MFWNGFYTRKKVIFIQILEWCGKWYKNGVADDTNMGWQKIQNMGWQMIHKHLNLVRWGSVALLCGKFSPCGTCPGERNKLCFFKSPQKCLKVNTLSPMTSTHSQGKNPTSKPLLPRHQIDSSGPGMSITEIMSPTCTKCGWKVVVHKSACTHIVWTILSTYRIPGIYWILTTKASTPLLCSKWVTRFPSLPLD